MVARTNQSTYKKADRLHVLLQVVWWGVFSKRYEDEIAAQTEVFGGPGGAGRLKALRLRVTEHNVLVVAKYYSRITLARLAELLDLPVEEARPDPTNHTTLYLLVWGKEFMRGTCLLGWSGM